MIIGKNTETKENVNIDLQRLIATRLLIQANAGGGKSWLIRRLLEQTHGKVQQIVIDLEGEFSTLREKYDYLLVGKDGEIPANIHTAKLLAKKLLKLNVSTIIDLSELKHHERITFVKRFLDSLVNAPRELWHTCLIVIDEAHQFCPEKTKSESASAVIDLLTRGRKRGFCGVLATQRIAKLHKDAAAECTNGFVGRTVMDIDRKRAAYDLGFSSRERELSLKKLGDGEFYAYGPAISKEDYVKLKVGEVSTTHPEPGKNILKASETPENIRKLLKDVIDLPKEVETELKTKKEFQNKINELKKELRLKPKVETDPSLIEGLKKKALNEGYKEGHKTGYGEGFEKMVEISNKEIERKASEILKILDKKLPINRYTFKPKTVLRRPVVTGNHTNHNLQGKGGDTHRTPAMPRSTSEDLVHKREELVKPADSYIQDGDINLSPAYLRMLKACASFYPNVITKAKVSFLAHVPQKASTFRNGLSKLRVVGAIENSGNGIVCTERGMSITGPIEEVPSDPEYLFEMWASKLSPAYTRMFQSIYESHPNSVSKDSISEISEVHIDASTFRNGLSKLRSLGLIKNEGSELKMCEDFFE